MEHETNTHILPKARIHKTKADKPKSKVETKVLTQVLGQIRTPVFLSIYDFPILFCPY
mgnify:FL=1